MWAAAVVVIGVLAVWGPHGSRPDLLIGAVMAVMSLFVSSARSRAWRDRAALIRLDVDCAVPARIGRWRGPRGVLAFAPHALEFTPDRGGGRQVIGYHLITRWRRVRFGAALLRLTVWTTTGRTTFRFQRVPCSAVATGMARLPEPVGVAVRY